MCNEEYRLERHGLTPMVLWLQHRLTSRELLHVPNQDLILTSNHVLHGTFTESCALVQDASAVGGQWAGPIAALSQ